MNYAIVAGALALIYLIVIKTIGLFLNSKEKIQEKAITEAKNDADKKTTIANESADDLQRMYDEYQRSKK